MLGEIHVFVRPHLVGLVVRVRHGIQQGSCSTRAAFFPYISPCIITMHVADLFVVIKFSKLFIGLEGANKRLLGGIQHLEAPP